MPLEYAELRESLIEAMRATLSSGVAAAELSNFSCADRTLGVFALRPPAIPIVELRPSDLPVLSLADGHVVVANSTPPSDAVVHLILYRHMPDIQAVAHVRSPYTTAWAQAGRDIPVLGSAHAQCFDGPIPAVRTSTPLSETIEDTQIGAAIVRWFSDNHVDPLARPATLVESHGAYTWGRTLTDALRCAAMLELIAMMAAWTIVLQPKAAAWPHDRVSAFFLRTHRPFP